MFLSIKMKKLVLLKNMPNSRLKCKNQTLLMIKMAKIDTLFMTKTAEKPYPLGPLIPSTHPKVYAHEVTLEFFNRLVI